MLAAIASALAVAAVGTTTASAGLNPGGLTVFDETVDVNVVFVGTFGGTDPDWNAVKAGRAGVSPGGTSSSSARAAKPRRAAKKR